jgi:hypothetical protein
MLITIIYYLLLRYTYALDINSYYKVSNNLILKAIIASIKGLKKTLLDNSIYLFSYIKLENIR